MMAFDVWVRPLGERCRVRVSGTGNAHWLMQKLAESFSLGKAQACPELQQLDVCSFEVPCQLPHSRNRLENALAAIPEVRLMTRPE
ncbi:MAG: hypothetical protein RIT02_3843 [Planctomycetota bacterium]|jgi:hypothetical protein